MKNMAGLVMRECHLCCEWKHLATYGDQRTYYDGLIRFSRDVDVERS